MKMEWNFEKIQKSASFSSENKAQIDRDFHFRLFELVSKNIDAFGGPRIHENQHFLHPEPGSESKNPPLFAPEDRFREQKQGGGLLRQEVEQPPPFRSGPETLAFSYRGGCYATCGTILRNE